MARRVTLPPNPRLQRTPAAPLSRKPLGDSARMAWGLKSEPSREPRQPTLGASSRLLPITWGSPRLVSTTASPNNALHRTRAAVSPSHPPVVSSPSSARGRAPVSFGPLGAPGKR
jgi:hypothetical protein